MLVLLVGQVSYSILQEISPVTHAVGNSLKRVVVIVSSVIFFQTTVSPLNAFGIFLTPFSIICLIDLSYFLSFLRFKGKKKERKEKERQSHLINVQILITNFFRNLIPLLFKDPWVENLKTKFWKTRNSIKVELYFMFSYTYSVAD